MCPEKGYLDYISSKNISLLTSEVVCIPWSIKDRAVRTLKYLEKW